MAFDFSIKSTYNSSIPIYVLAYLHFAIPAIETINQTDIPEQLLFAGNVGFESPVCQSGNRKREILFIH